jgi:hypothetical protein
MRNTLRVALFAVAVLAMIVASACGPTYVVQNPNGQQVAYDPGYDPNQFAYDAVLTAAILNGQRGYYGAGHVFYPYVSVGGVDGYYDSGHHFHTSVTNRTVVINHYNHDRDEFVKTHPAPAPGQKPNFGNTPGTAGRGVANAPVQQQQQQAGKPNFGSNPGSAGRGTYTPAPAPSGKPNFGSNPGSAGRGVSAPAAAPRSAPASAPAASRPKFGKH